MSRFRTSFTNLNFFVLPFLHLLENHTPLFVQISKVSLRVFKLQCGDPLLLNLLLSLFLKSHFLGCLMHFLDTFLLELLWSQKLVILINQVKFGLSFLSDP